MKNDYQIIVEKKYYAVFTDGEGKQQKVEVTKEVADTIIKEQQAERALVRKNERYTISLDALDYEGEIFATYDDYDFLNGERDLTHEQKVRIALSKMKPKQAELLVKVVLRKIPVNAIAEEEHVTKSAISHRIELAKAAFKKFYEKLS